MESFDLNLIQLVEKCPNLYAKSRPDYKDRNKVQNSWSSIAKTLNIEGMYYTYYNDLFVWFNISK